MTWTSIARRSLFNCIVFLGLITGPAMAQAPIYNWTGFYVGANAGGSWGHSNSDFVYDQISKKQVVTNPFGSTSQTMSGVLGGLQAGYSFRTSPFVFGVETDFQLTGQTGHSQLSDTVLIPQECLAPCVPPPPKAYTGTLNYSQKLPWLGTLRGRIGITPVDRWLVYATGGLAFGEIKSDASVSVPGGVCLAPCVPTPPGFAAGSFRQTRTGWVLGGGAEAALGGGWTAKFEYLHVDLGDLNNSFASAAYPFQGTFRTSSRVTDDIVRIGVNYYFGGTVLTN